MKTIKDAVIELGGKLPNTTYRKTSNAAGWYISSTRKLTHAVDCVWFAPGEFKACAKRLGYINGYRYGVEYPTNGKRPDLPDDVEVSVYGGNYSNVIVQVRFAPWTWIKRFKITDPRYKPVDEASEIQESKPEAECVSEILGCKQKPKSVNKNHIVEVNEKVINARPCWPPVAGMTVELWFGGQYVENVEFLCERGGSVIFWRYSNDSVESAAMPTAELKPIRTEREKVIEAAVKTDGSITKSQAESLYNAGMLVLPPKKEGE